MSSNESGFGSGSLIIKYDGARATDHVLTLDRYVESLTGWRDFFTLATELYLHANPDLRAVKREELFQFRIEAEREGSYEVVIAFILGGVANGIIGNRSDAAFLALYQRLLGWYKKLIASHINAKQRSRNVDRIVEALEAMTRAENVELDLATESTRQVLDSQTAVDGPQDEEDATTYQSPMRTLVDKIDTSLRHAASPIGIDCNTINISGADRGFEIVSFGAVEKAILNEPLTLPLPAGIWNPITVRFERINRKTGRALVYVDKDQFRSDSASYARIVDPSFSDPGNVYAQAFTDDTQLEVWGRQVRAERGRLNLMWQISHKPPDQLAMFGPEGSRA